MNKHHYFDCGLNNIYLHDVAFAEEGDGRGRRIAETDRLHHAIAAAIVLSSRKLRGMELCFLRTELGLEISEYSAMLGVPKIRLFKWEEGMLPVSASADLAARLIYAASCSDGELGREIVRMVRSGLIRPEAAIEDLVFERGSSGWVLMKQVTD